MIGEGFLRVMRVKIAVCSNATNKIFTRFTHEKTRLASALYFATSLLRGARKRDAAISTKHRNAPRILLIVHCALCIVNCKKHSALNPACGQETQITPKAPFSTGQQLIINH
jgi:hypothetical protein